MLDIQPVELWSGERMVTRRAPTVAAARNANSHGISHDVPAPFLRGDGATCRG
jgi:hypothetical protein